MLPMIDMGRLAERANGMLADARALGKPPRGIAMPFGVKDPGAWRWRLSWDIAEMIAMTLAADLPADTPIPVRLLGIDVHPDPDLPPNSLILEAVG